MRPERLEGWRNAAIPSIKQKLKLDPRHSAANSIEETDAAINAFEEALVAAQRYRRAHLGEDAEMRHAAMAHIFEHIGMLPLDAVRLVSDLFPET